MHESEIRLKAANSKICGNFCHVIHELQGQHESHTRICLCSHSCFRMVCGSARSNQASICTFRSRNNSQHRAARASTAARANPLDLRAFLAAMPKGGDLHVHLVGAVYAESWIGAAAEDQMCVNISSLSLVQPHSQGTCEQGEVPAGKAYHDQHLYDALVDAFSMRGFVPSAGVTGHDHFFDAFPKFMTVDPRHTGEWLDEVATRAAAQNEQYLELMVTPPFDHTAAIAKEFGWSANRGFTEFREQLLAHGLRDDVAVVRSYLDQAESSRRQSERCGEPNPAAPCDLKIRYIYQVLRALTLGGKTPYGLGQPSLL